MKPTELEDGRFVLLEQLGEGSMGAVYRARDSTDGSERAVKMLHAGFSRNHVVVARFAREAQLMSALNHDHIVQVLHIGEEGGSAFLVMELLEGGNLADRIKGGPLPPREAASICIGILKALQCAHDAGIVHRDIKPENILLDRDGTPKLTDFGIARSTAQESSLTRTGWVMGTSGYMSPEQLEGARLAEARSDIYSLGAVLFEAASGGRPYQLYSAGTAEKGLSRIGEPLAGILRRATAPDASDRYPSADAMRHALAGCLDQLSDAAVPAGPTRLEAVKVMPIPPLISREASVVPDAPPVAPREEARTVLPFDDDDDGGAVSRWRWPLLGGLALGVLAAALFWLLS